MLEDNLAHQAVEDYQSMHFEFPDENIMLVTDYEEPGPYEGPESGSHWTIVFDRASNALGNKICCNYLSSGLSYTPHYQIML